MWNVLKNVFVRSTRVISRGFVWWFEKLGENPSLSRDPGIVAWQTVNARKREDDSELPAGELAKKDSDDDDGRSHRPPLMRRRILPLQRSASRRRALGIFRIALGHGGHFFQRRTGLFEGGGLFAGAPGQRLAGGGNLRGGGGGLGGPGGQLICHAADGTGDRKRDQPGAKGAHDESAACRADCTFFVCCTSKPC